MDVRKHSSTSNIVRFVLKNSSTGQGLTGLTSASSGLIISTIADNEATATVYTAAASNIETIVTLGTYAAPTASKCRFKEVDATNHKGLYELHFADARFSVANTEKLVISVTGATSLLDADYEIQLVQYDPFDAVRLGLTALPNAAADASGGLIISDAGGLDADAMNAAAVRLTAARAQAIDDWINGGRLDLILDIIAADVVNIDGSAMRGTDGANTVAPDNATITAIAGYLNTEIAAILEDTGTTIPGLIAALNDPTAAAIAAAVYTYNMGNGRTIGEALAFLRNKWTLIAGVLTVYDTDDTTVLWTSAVVQTAGDPVSSSDPA